MLTAKTFTNKNVLVVGLARSGYAATCLLLKLGAKVTVTEKDASEELKKVALELQAKGAKVELGGHSKDIIKNKDLAVLSPGVDNRSNIAQWLDKEKILTVSEIELGFWLCPARIIAVTGTNGKTTVTSLIGRCLKHAGYRVHICGNIGVPFTSKVLDMSDKDFVSLEVSSFQLERILYFKPFISVMLNFTPDHLDRYANVEEYLSAKKRIFINQDNNDFAVLNYEDIYVRKMAKDIKAKVVFFSEDERWNPNFSAVKKVTQILGIDDKKTEEVFLNFEGIEHRLERVAEFRGIEFINDSKATNVESTMWALHNIKKPIILIAGGRNKGLNFDKIKPIIRNKVKLLVLIGEARKILKNEFKDLLDIKEADSLEDAVKFSFEHAKEGEAVLFSPMCASFDMFRNYEDRGNRFKEIVKKIISK